MNIDFCVYLFTGSVICCCPPRLAGKCFPCPSGIRELAQAAGTDAHPGGKLQKYRGEKATRALEGQISRSSPAEPQEPAPETGGKPIPALLIWNARGVTETIKPNRFMGHKFQRCSVLPPHICLYMVGIRGAPGPQEDGVRREKRLQSRELGRADRTQSCPSPWRCQTPGSSSRGSSTADESCWKMYSTAPTAAKG